MKALIAYYHMTYRNSDINPTDWHNHGTVMNVIMVDDELDTLSFDELDELANDFTPGGEDTQYRLYGWAVCEMEDAIDDNTVRVGGNWLDTEYPNPTTKAKVIESFA